MVSPVKPARTVEVKPIQKQAEEASLLGDEDEEDPNTVDLLVGVSCIFESRPLLSLSTIFYSLKTEMKSLASFLAAPFPWSHSASHSPLLPV